ncbi:MAG: aldo/keto reductase, partial [bacterium]
QTDTRVSTIALGCWAFAGGGNWGPQNDEDSINTVDAALSHGINFLDTAEGYGDGYSESIIGKALKNRRHEAVIATKPKPDRATSDELQKACDESLRRLGTDYIDLYQQHWPNRDVPLEETVAGMERLKEQGKIRAFGVCNYGTKDLGNLLAHATPVTNQLAYSLIWRAIEFEVQPKCEDNGIGILCYSPIAQGLLTGKYRSADEVPVGRARTKHFADSREQARHGHPGAEKETFEAIDRVRTISAQSGFSMLELSVGWLMKQPAVTSVLTGARTPEQLRQNAAAADVTLPSDVLDELTRATDELKGLLGSNPDPWADRMS